jgi:ABC-type multidrug transport system fused ATPase/permease subunit
MRCCTIISQAYGRSKASCANAEHTRFNRVSNQLRHATLVVMRVWAIYSPSMSLFEAIGALPVLGFGGHAVLTGNMQIGDLVAFLMLTAFLYDPVTRLHAAQSTRQAGRAAGERVFEIMDEPTEPGFGLRRHVAAQKRRRVCALQISKSSAIFATKTSASATWKD